MRVRENEKYLRIEIFLDQGRVYRKLLGQHTAVDGNNGACHIV